MDYTGTSGDDAVVGTDEDDSFVTNGGNDSFAGGGGDDILIFNAVGTLVFIGGDGFDTLDVSELRGPSDWSLGDDVEGFVGGKKDNYVIANDVTIEVARRMDGGGGDDNLGGGGAGDTLIGGKGNDTLEGYRGVDTLIGGKGADSFVFRIGWDFDADDHGGDLIRDLGNDDSLVFDGTLKLKDIHVSYDAAHHVTVFAIDRDRDGQADFTIRASGEHTDFPIDHDHILVLG